MSSIRQMIQRRWLKWAEMRMKIPITPFEPLIRPGSPYGGWIIPAQALHRQSVVYLVGAGEDISFDLEVASKFGCEVQIIDPTPRATRHVQQLIDNIRSGNPTPLEHAPTGFYPVVPPETADLLRLRPIGLWDSDTHLRFFAPANEKHVSHSIVNLQKTENFIEVPVKRLSNLMKEWGHERIDLLKIDIEGAEYTVLNTILADNLEIDIICVEFDETASNHIDKGYIQRIESAINALVEAGFQVVAKEKNCNNFTLLHQRFFN